MVKQLCLLVWLGMATLGASATELYVGVKTGELYVNVKTGELYVNVKTGADTNPGTQSQPLKTIEEAARRVNADSARGTTTIILSEGVYLLTETALIRNDKFTIDNRLVIRAEVLPDDAGWNPQRMPIIVTLAPAITNAGGEEAKGLEVEVSHVTIEGLRFTGGPVYAYMDGKKTRRVYPIWRDGKALDDLLVTQCLFAGDADVLPVRVAVIANGQGLVVDHCVFIDCNNPVVFWNAEGGISRRNAMRYCLVYGSYYSGVWTTESTADDIEFHHNIIANCRATWVSEHKGPHLYQVHDCIFIDNGYLTTNGAGLAAPADLLQMENVQTTGTIVLEKDQSKNNYLQLKEGSFGSGLGAGLFKKLQ